MASHIEVLAARRPGSRAPELLRLSDGELVAALAGKRAAEIGERTAAIDPARCRAEIAAAGLWAVCRHHDAYPEGLRDAPDGPAALIGRGDPARLAALELDATVAVVGSRRPGPYGREVARGLTRELAAAGMVVVSGMAAGIDSCAHHGALDGGGLTVAVLGNGTDRPYPASQTGLYGRIAATGLVLSECPPGARAYRWRFPARNRIMAALGRMTIVVEAAGRSGSLITAELAGDLGREVGAVPGPVNSWLSAGTNRLLRDGAAVIRDATDVLDSLLGAGCSVRAGPPSGPPLDRESLALLRRVEAGPATPDAIAVASRAAAPLVAAALTRLELLGYLRGEPGGRYARTLLQPPEPGAP